MSVSYQAIGWNRQKHLYDRTLLGLLALALVTYAGVSLWLHSTITAETLLIRGTSLTALLLLHVILAIGPLARLDPRFNSWLYNRRHLGVTFFLLALTHAGLTVFQFHAVGDQPAWWSALTAYRQDYGILLGSPQQWSRFPFEILGAGALVIFLGMAITSHDFWLKNLGPSVWKILHQGVYLAYALVVLHVALGALQSERHPLLAALLLTGVVSLVALHLLAAWRERSKDQAMAREEEGWVSTVPVNELREGEGCVVVVEGERRALFLHQGRLFCLSNACRHQGGPLGEGRIKFDCLTCPWHGYQYRLEDGCSPPPLTEIVPTYPVRVMNRIVQVHREALPLQTRSEGVTCEAASTGDPEPTPFYIGWEEKSAPALARHSRTMVAGLAVAVVMVMALLAWGQEPVDEGQYEFGMVKSVEGLLLEYPLPLLVTDEGRVCPLVGAGKFGPPEALKGHHGHRVRLSGSWIVRRNQPLFEVNRPEATEILSGSTACPAPVELGAVRLRGELVDTKCFLGVMRPATGKIHKGCAIRCLSGGVPPGLLLRAADGNGIVVWLTGARRQPLNYEVQWAAEVIEVEGVLRLWQGEPMLEVQRMERVRAAAP